MWIWWYNLKWRLRPKIRYAVITGVPDDHDGNCYDEILVTKPVNVGIAEGGGDLLEDRFVVATAHDIKPNQIYMARLPVFTKGEILMVNRYGREVDGRGRKPSKWFVDCEYFWTRRKAIQRSNEVMKEPV